MAKLEFRPQLLAMRIKRTMEDDGDEAARLRVQHMLALTKGVESVHNMPLLRRRELARNLVYRVYEQGEIGTRKGAGRVCCAPVG